MFCWRSLSSVADNEGAGGCFDDVVGDGFELVDLQYAGDVRKSRSSSRKLPRVIRSIAAIAWASVKSSGSSDLRDVALAPPAEPLAMFPAMEVVIDGGRPGCRENALTAGWPPSDDDSVKD